MEIRVKRNELIKALTKVSKIVNKNSTLPILKSVLLVAKEDSLLIRATDLAVDIETKVYCEVIQEGKVAVDDRLFLSYLRKLKDEVVIIKEEENKIMIKASKSKLDLLKDDAVNYPSSKEITNVKSIKLNADELTKGIHNTIYAVSKDEIRPILTGILIEKKNKTLRFVAIDGYRIAYQRFEIEDDEEIQIIVPARTMQLLYGLLQEVEEVEIMFNENTCIFKTEKFTLKSSLLEGQFIDYEQIINTERTIKAIVDTKEIVESLERAKLLVNATNNTSIKLIIKDDVMKITTNNDLGAYSDELTIELEGEDLEIAFNVNYLLDALKRITSERCIFYLVSSVKPVIIVNYDNEDLINLILPIRINK